MEGKVGMAAAELLKNLTGFNIVHAEFASFMQAQVDKWANVIKADHIALIT